MATIARNDDVPADVDDTWRSAQSARDARGASSSRWHYNCRAFVAFLLTNYTDVSLAEMQAIVGFPEAHRKTLAAIKDETLRFFQTGLEDDE